ncbi:MAG: response regulator transcription factor [Phycisphaerae bacterium]
MTRLHTLPADLETKQRLVLEWLLWLTGGAVACSAVMKAANGEGGAVRPHHRLHATCSAPPFDETLQRPPAEVVEGFLQSRLPAAAEGCSKDAVRLDPFAPDRPWLTRLLDTAADGYPDPSTLARRDLCTDTVWRTTDLACEYGDAVYSCMRAGNPGLFIGLSVWRPRNVAPFNALEITCVYWLHSVTEWLFKPAIIASRSDEVGLNERERETFMHLLAGQSEKQIAHRMNRSRHTVHTYVKRIYRQLGVNSRGELLARFIG